MYAVTFYRHDDGGENDVWVHTVAAEEMRKYCLKHIRDSLDFLDNEAYLSNPTYKKFVPLFNHARKELRYIKNGKNPKKIKSYDKYTLERLIKDIVESNQLHTHQLYYTIITHIIYGENMTVIAE